MNTMPSAVNMNEVVQNLSTSINKVEEAFKLADIDEYEAEMFYKGLCDAKSFVSTLNWLIKHHDL